MDIKRYRSQFSKMGEQAKEELIMALKNLGQDAIDYAYKNGFMSKLNPRKKDDTQSIVWKHETGNLHDSIGSAVYVNGELREDTICYVGGGQGATFGKTTTDSIDSRSGRTVLLEYLRKIHPNKGKNTVTLVCVAAMYYTKFLESGTYANYTDKDGNKVKRASSKWKIRVISGATDYIKQNQDRYTSRVYKKLGIRFPNSKVIRGDVQPLKDYGYYG